VFELDHEHYQYSLVCDPDKSYVWILARGPKIKDDIKDILIAKATALGIDTSKLIFVDHD
jgi:apolipoprotein D and lipocalin family protein